MLYPSRPANGSPALESKTDMKIQAERLQSNKYTNQYLFLYEYDFEGALKSLV